LTINKMRSFSLSCRGRIRTSTRQLAAVQCCGGQPQSLRFQNGIMLRLSCFPHPRDKRACLPKFHHSTVFLKELNTAILKNIPILCGFFKINFEKFENIQIFVIYSR
jgi:hypothetical protein